MASTWIDRGARDWAAVEFMDVMDVDEANLRSMAAADDLIDEADAELFRAVHDALAVEEGKIPCPEQVATAARAEVPLLSAVECMDDMVQKLRSGAASLASRPGEETVVAALLSKAASVEAVRAGVIATVDAARRMLEDELRRMAATEEDVVDPEEARAIQQASRDMALAMGAGAVPTHEQALAAAAAAAIGQYAAEVIVAEMTELAGRLRKGAAPFASRPGEEAIVMALQSKAASAERHAAEAQAMAATYRTFRLSLPLQL
jgi:hypothetical protein